MARIDVDALGEYIREQRDAAQLSLRQLARSAGVSNPYLSQVERGLKRPSAEILSKIASALAISAESLYVRAGILQARDGDPAVTSALATDLTLTERQRQTLLEMYAAFQLTNTAATRADGNGASHPGDDSVVRSHPGDDSVVRSHPGDDSVAPADAGGTDPAPRTRAADPDRDPREESA